MYVQEYHSLPSYPLKTGHTCQVGLHLRFIVKWRHQRRGKFGISSYFVLRNAVSKIPLWTTGKKKYALYCPFSLCLSKWRISNKGSNRHILFLATCKEVIMSCIWLYFSFTIAELENREERDEKEDDRGDGKLASQNGLWIGLSLMVPSALVLIGMFVYVKRKTLTLHLPCPKTIRLSPLPGQNLSESPSDFHASI